MLLPYFSPEKKLTTLFLFLVIVLSEKRWLFAIVSSPLLPSPPSVCYTDSPRWCRPPWLPDFR